MKNAFEYHLEGQRGEALYSSVLFGYVKREGRSIHQSHFGSLKSMRNDRNTSHLLPNLPSWVSFQMQAACSGIAAAGLWDLAQGRVRLLCPTSSTCASEHSPQCFRSLYCHPLLYLSTSAQKRQQTPDEQVSFAVAHFPSWSPSSPSEQTGTFGN